MYFITRINSIFGFIFDFDGTLADTSRIWYNVDREFLLKRNLPYIPGYSERLAALGLLEGAKYTRELYGLSETANAIYEEWIEMSRDKYIDDVILKPGAKRFILALRSLGIPCALATTNEKSVIYSMKKVDVLSLFDSCVFSSEVGFGKDRPDIYIETARRLSLDVKNCIVFEDIAPALYSAKQAGAFTCAVRTRISPKRWNSIKSSADYWIDDWRSLTLSKLCV